PLPPPPSTLFPYTTLFRSHHFESRSFPPRSKLREQIQRPVIISHQEIIQEMDIHDAVPLLQELHLIHDFFGTPQAVLFPQISRIDRKSTRLNSSHLVISYA